MARKIVKASELRMAGQLKAAVASTLAPLAAWETINEPEAYLESRVGKYIHGLERLLEIAIKHNDFEGVRTLTLDLLRMTRLGKAKADLTVTSVNKLRDEFDFTKIDTESLRKLVTQEEK